MSETSDGSLTKSRRSASRVIGWICVGTIGVSVLSCVVLAALRSNGIVQITVTALDQAKEPRDHNLPFIKQKEALPDYELKLILANGGQVQLGAKPDTSAAKGLTWQVSDPISVADVASVRLEEQDKIISDALAEVQIKGDSVTANGYRFDYVMERSAAVGIKSFFGTPIGMAIVVGFCLAVVLIVITLFWA